MHNLVNIRQFKQDNLSDKDLELLAAVAAQARVDLLKIIHNAGSGHMGGALSLLDLYLMLHLCANISCRAPNQVDRDRIIVSCGHTSAGLYAVLGNLGFFEIDDVIAGFRKENSIFEGHPNCHVPGVEWCSGSLGQGLSVGCGLALGAKIKQENYRVFVVMGDGEQSKGQLQEAREFASKYKLGNLIAIVDHNQLQASGKLADIMPQNIARKYLACDWQVIEIDGHDFQAIYQALRTAYYSESPVLILSNTVMGKGVKAIENNYEYHGKGLTPAMFTQAVDILSSQKQKLNIEFLSPEKADSSNIEETINYGQNITYKSEELVDCRSTFGNALYSLAAANCNNKQLPIVAVDCDLAESVKLQKFAESFPANFVECGIQEHNAATVAAALSKLNLLTFFADFGVFGLNETYGQHRMSDFNHSSLKLICTHCGLDVGEDGKTHQAIDYIGLAKNLLGFKLIIPADANECDRAVRYAATHFGNIIIAMGRSKLPVLTEENGDLLFGGDQKFEYGTATWVRRNEKDSCVIITCGSMVNRAVKVWSKLKEININVGILNLSSPLQLDYEKINFSAGRGMIVTYEDHYIDSGIGSIIGAYLAEQNCNCKFHRVGIKKYGLSASVEAQYKHQFMDEDSLVELIKKERKG